MRSALALAVGRPYLRWSTGRRLDGVFATGVDRARAALDRGPVVFAANHVSWWDGPIGVVADGVTGAESLYLVDAANLARVPFLRWFGAVDLDRSSALAMRRGLVTALDWLVAPRRAVWVFPQGRQRPAHLRPLDLARGAEWLARRAGAQLVPVALSYGFRDDPRPTAAVAFGAPIEPRLDALDEALTRQLAELDGFFDGNTPLSPLIAPRRAGIDDGLGARLLAAGARRTT